MPLPITLAHKLVKKLATVRKENILSRVRPDSKSQVTIEYENGKAKRIDTIVISTQHDPDVTHEQIEKDVFEHVITPVCGNMLDENTKLHINPTGKFVIGGPHGDSGLTGRKIIIDTYGGVGRHGGGAFSGKDPSKVDRSAAYMARYVAKNIVASGICDKCEIQLSYAIGVAQPTSIYVDCYGTEKVALEKISQAVQDNFDLSPAGIISTLDLKRPIYSATAAYGHFGRDEFSWEQTDKKGVFEALI
jgi:S-adenosylmethionine synthetase